MTACSQCQSVDDIKVRRDVSDPVLKRALIARVNDVLFLATIAWLLIGVPGLRGDELVQIAPHRIRGAR